jgi:Zn finger protein HypA/HybF involved in hydrogenase expression
MDLEKDERKCYGCSSPNVKSIKELRGSICPKCKSGTIREIDTGILS